MTAAADERRPFREYLERLAAEFEAFLAAKYSRRTARKHALVVQVFVDFLCDYTDVAALEEVTRGMANSAFRAWYKRKVLWATDADELRLALKKFFQFLAAEKGIVNAKVLESFR
jgi:integrase family protein with SAM-like domain